MPDTKKTRPWPGFFESGRTPARVSLDAAAGAGACGTTLQRATLVLAHAAPDACILARLEGPREAVGGDGGTVHRRASRRRPVRWPDRWFPRGGRTAPDPRRDRWPCDASPFHYSFRRVSAHHRLADCLLIVWLVTLSSRGRTECFRVVACEYFHESSRSQWFLVNTWATSRPAPTTPAEAAPMGGVWTAGSPSV